MESDQLKAELHEAYVQYYVEGFRTNDVSLIDQVVKYPLAYVTDGVVTMCESYPIEPRKLKDEKGWNHSTNWKFEILAINEANAHAIASADRHRQDGSKIESVHGFYAFIKIEGRWRIYSFAEITF